MRDDFQIPNMGQSSPVYSQTYIDRVVRNIETTFQTLKAVGRNKVRSVNYMPIPVADLGRGFAGDVAYASNGRKAGEGVGAGTGVRSRSLERGISRPVGLPAF